jgi:hypothetical protein
MRTLTATNVADRGPRLRWHLCQGRLVIVVHFNDIGRLTARQETVQVMVAVVVAAANATHDDGQVICDENRSFAF